MASEQEQEENRDWEYWRGRSAYYEGQYNKARSDLVYNVGYKIEQLEQQLAQAQADLEAWPQKWAHTIDNYSQLLAGARAELAQARALLEAFVVDETERVGLYWDESVGMPVCVYCESGNGHLPDCPIVQARAFLAREEGA